MLKMVNTFQELSYLLRTLGERGMWREHRKSQASGSLSQGFPALHQNRVGPSPHTPLKHRKELEIANGKAKNATENRSLDRVRIERKMTREQEK